MPEPTVKPAIVYLAEVPDHHVTSLCVRGDSRLAVERLVLGNALGNAAEDPTLTLSIWRNDHIDTYRYRPGTEPDMPASPTHPRRRRQVGYAECLDAIVTKLRAEGWEVDMPAQGMLRWRAVCAAKPGDARTHIYLQAPSTHGLWLARLWAAGMRIDGFNLINPGAILHTIIREPDQMTIVRGLIRWLTGYIAVTPEIGLPPPPYRLIAAHSLVERIVAHDTIVPSTTTPTSN